MPYVNVQFTDEEYDLIRWAKGFQDMSYPDYLKSKALSSARRLHAAKLKKQVASKAATEAEFWGRHKIGNEGKITLDVTS